MHRQPRTGKRGIGFLQRRLREKGGDAAPPGSRAVVQQLLRLLQRQIAGKEGHQQGGLGGRRVLTLTCSASSGWTQTKEQALIERGVHPGQQAQLADILHRLVGGEIARVCAIDLVLRPVQPRLAVAVRPVAKGGGDLAGAQRRLAEQRQQPNEDVGR